MPSGAGDRSLERGGDEPADQVRASADVDGRDRDRGVFAARVLPHVQRADRLDAGDEDQEVDDEREDGPADEEIGDGSHGSFPSGVRRTRSRLRVGCQRVIDRDRRHRSSA